MRLFLALLLGFFVGANLARCQTTVGGSNSGIGVTISGGSGSSGCTPAGAAGQVLTDTGAGACTSSAAFTWSSTNGIMQTDSTGTFTLLGLTRSAGTATGIRQTWQTSRGTVASPTISSSGDNIVDWKFNARGSAGFGTAGGILARVIGTPGANAVGGSVAMYALDNTGALKSEVGVEQDGTISLNNIFSSNGLFPRAGGALEINDGTAGSLKPIVVSGCTGCGGSSPGGSGTELQYRAGVSSFGAMIGSSWDNTNRLLQLQDANGNSSLYVGADPNFGSNAGFAFNAAGVGPDDVAMGNGVDGGAVDVRGFSGGNTTDIAAFGGAGGDFVARGGIGGNGGLGGFGGGLTFFAGNGGNGSAGNGGAGGTIFFQAGAGGTGGDANGGDITFHPGSKQGAGLAGKVKIATGFSTELGSCTAATLSTILTANTDACMCTDCQPTSGSDDTCTGSGGVWLAYKTASAVVCR